MAGYPGMKPMLQFTNLPPPPRERRRRRRKPVRTPEVPKVKSIPLARGGAEADDQENLPRPCLKWVSPQFCDELTENGTHLKNHNPRRKKKNITKQPLQEMKELFPTESNNNAQQCPKSTTRRNPLRFKQNPDQCFVQVVDRTRKSHTSSTAWCSQEISMYPSTCMPHSKLRSFEDESSDESLTDGENNEHVRCSGGLDDRDCHVCPSLSSSQNVHLDSNAQLDGADDHTVPSASQDHMEGGNFIDIRLRLSTMTQHTEVSNPTHRHREDTCRLAVAKVNSQLISSEDSHLNLHRATVHTSQSNYLQEKCSIHAKELADSATNADHSNDGRISYPSVEDLSELMRDMSVGDDVACNEQSAILSAPADDHNQFKHDHSMHLEQHECIRLPNCTSTSASGNCRLYVSAFNPHLASTPFRDQHLQTDQTLDWNLVRSNKLEARIEVTPGHQEEQEMSILVRETPEHLWCSPKLASVENQRAKYDGKGSFRVSESIFQPAGLNSLCNDSNRTEPPPQHTSLTQSDVDMTTFNNFDNTDTSHTTMGDSHSDSTTVDICGCLHPNIPPTQDSTHSGEEEWSILAKQTPDELWNSPVVRVVDDSLNST